MCSEFERTHFAVFNAPRNIELLKAVHWYVVILFYKKKQIKNFYCLKHKLL